MWTVIVLLLAIAFIVIMTGKAKMHAFMVLLLAAYIVGLLAGVKPPDILKAIKDGFGGTCSSIGIVITLGAILGYILEKSGAALTMANSMLALVGKARAALAMALTGYIVSIPVFCDSGFVILSPLNRALAENSKKSLATMGVALSLGLYVTHCLVPPTPGPIGAAGNIGADLGTVLLIGLISAFPGMIAGWIFAEKYASKFHIEPKPEVTLEELQKKYGHLPSALKSFLPIVVPIVLICLKSIADFPSQPFGAGTWKIFFDFIGEPITALLIGTFLAMLTVPKITQEMISDWFGEGVKTAGWIILITAAGGALGGVLKVTPIAAIIGDSLSKLHLGLFLPFIISAALKTAQGSSTVALITTSSLLAPLLEGMGMGSPMAKVLVVMAIGAGSMTVSHANDSYFWVVSQFSDIKEVTVGYRTQTLGTLVVGIVTIIWIWLLSLVLM